MDLFPLKIPTIPPPPQKSPCPVAEDHRQDNGKSRPLKDNTHTCSKLMSVTRDYMDSMDSVAQFIYVCMSLCVQHKRCECDHECTSFASDFAQLISCCLENTGFTLKTK